MFIHPMWDSESERIGLQRCTPGGALLRSLADLTGLLGLLGLPLTCVILGKWKLPGGFWWLAFPVGLGIAGRVMFSLSWRLARKKNFKYDAERGEASWTEHGEHRTYTWQPGDS